VADLTAWDTRRYLALLRQQAEKLRADPAVRSVRFSPDELAAETLSRAADSQTPACTATVERDRLAWLLRIERDILYGLCDAQQARTATWAGAERDAALKSVGQALLNSTAAWDEALEKAKPSTDDETPAPFDKYEDFKLVSQGGMGAVYRCRDRELGRVIAMKVMHGHLMADPSHLQDFREEAQVASQLQHPNIAPIHERGKTPDGRPYFTMKLIQGKTWAEAIAEHHGNPSSKSVDALLRQFLAVCETVAFAHKKDVLHRDLKPLNVMVGAFGEVQVMDWGLAKVVRNSERQSRGEDASSVLRVPHGPETKFGAVRGTFAYMPPEQADPAKGPVDRRADVFALGSILCEILTGRPAYSSNATDRTERSNDLWAKARDCRTEPALQRLEMSEAPKELIRLVERCLSSRPQDRPETADAVGKIVEGYFARRKEEERSGHIKKATSGERRKKRGWQVALGLSIAVAALLGMGGYGWYYQQTQARIESVVQEVKAALERSAEIQARAAAMPVETPTQAEAALVVWLQALVAAENAETLLKPETSEEHRAEVEAVIAATRERAKAAEGLVVLAKKNEKLLTDLKLCEQFAAVRLVGFRPDFETSTKAFNRSFQEYGVDVLAADPVPSIAKLKLVPASRKGEMIRGLDYWATIDAEQRKKLRNVADALDDNSWRREFRQALDSKGDESLLTLAKEAAAAVGSNEADLLGDALRERGRANEAVKLLHEAERSKPGEYWLQMSLGLSLCALKPADYLAAAECFKSARGLETTSAAAANNHALALMRTGFLDRALIAMKDAVALQDTSAALHCNLAVVYNSKTLGDPAAEREANRAHELDPKYEEAIAVQALCKVVRGDRKAAEERLGKLSSTHQETTTPLFCRMLLAMTTIPAKEREAAGYARRVAKLDPRSEAGLFCRVIAEVLDGDTLAAEKAANDLIAECPYGVWEVLGQTILAEVLIYQGRLEDADTALKNALRRKDIPTAHDALFKLRLRQGRFEDAAKELKAFKDANTDVTILSTLYKVNDFLLEGARKVEAHTDAVADNKEPLKVELRSLVAETALLKGRLKLARELYKEFVIVSEKPALEFYASHGLSVVTSYEGLTHWTNAARAGVRIAAGIGLDLDSVVPAVRLAAREEALDFLRSDLEFKKKMIDGPMRIIVRKILPSMTDHILSRERFRRWMIFCLQCDDFRSVREPQKLAKLPEKERKAWEKLWEDIRGELKSLPLSPLPKKK